MFTRCPYCHRWVLRWFYASHEAKHTRRRSDGQMAEHVSAPPEDRFPGPLDGVPQGYRHAACGVVTRMPEEIIRTYLVNPMAYSDGSFCCGCGEYVDSSGLVWEETGERVMDYMGRLRSRYLRDVLGMALPDRVDGLVLTPRAARKLQSILRDLAAPSAFVFLGVPEAGETDFKLDIGESYDAGSDAVISAAGISIVVPKRHVERISGVVIDHLEAPQKGFAVVRLYAPAE